MMMAIGLCCCVKGAKISIYRRSTPILVLFFRKVSGEFIKGVPTLANTLVNEGNRPSARLANE